VKSEEAQKSAIRFPRITQHRPVKIKHILGVVPEALLDENLMRVATPFVDKSPVL